VRRGVRYLLLDVVERVGGVDGKADQDNVRVGIGERAQTVVIFLTRGIPQSQLNVFAINLNVGDVVLEDGGNVDLRGVTSVFVQPGTEGTGVAIASPWGRPARLTQPRKGGGGTAGTDLREGALGEDTAGISLATKGCVAGGQAAMAQAALT